MKRIILFISFFLSVFWVSSLYAHNSGLVGTEMQTPAGVDNVKIDAITCRKPKDVSALNIWQDSIFINWDSDVGKYTVECVDYFTRDEVFNEIVEENQTVVRGLNPSTKYDVTVKAVCANEDSDWSQALTFTTLCAAEEFPNAQSYGVSFASGVPPADNTCWIEGVSGVLSATNPVVIQEKNVWDGGFLGNNTQASSAAKLVMDGQKEGSWLVTPQLKTSELKELEIRFRLSSTEKGTTNQADIKNGQRLMLLAGTTRNFIKGNIIDSWGTNPSEGKLLSNIPAAGEEVLISIEPKGKDLYFAFYGISTSTEALSEVFVTDLEFVPIYPEPCDGAKDINVLADGRNLLVTWSATPGQTFNWNLICKDVTDETIPEIGVNLDGNVVEYTFERLAIGHTYEVSLKATCIDLISEIKQSERVKIEDCGEVTNLSKSNVCPTSAVLTWEGNVNIHDSWTVKYNVSGNAEVLEMTVTEKRATLEDLEPNESYEISVTANCGTEESGLETIELETPICPQVQNVKIIPTADSNEIKVQFDNPMIGCVEYWDVSVTEEGLEPSDGTITRVDKITDNDITIPDTVLEGYDVYVRTVCDANRDYYGEWTKYSDDDAPSGINDVGELTVNVVLAPNPAKGYAKLSIQGVTVSNVQMTILTIEGKVVRTETITSSTTDANLDGLAKGSYLVKLVGEDWMKTEVLFVL